MTCRICGVTPVEWAICVGCGDEIEDDRGRVDLRGHDWHALCWERQHRAGRSTCRICGAVIADADTHREWHKTLPVTEAGLAHERRVRADEMRRGMRGEA